MSGAFITACVCVTAELPQAAPPGSIAGMRVRYAGTSGIYVVRNTRTGTFGRMVALD